MSLPTEPDEREYHQRHRAWLAHVLSVCSPGDSIWLCRTQGAYCDLSLQPVCQMCKIIKVKHGTTLEDLLAIKLES